MHQEEGKCQNYCLDLSVILSDGYTLESVLMPNAQMRRDDNLGSDLESHRPHAQKTVCPLNIFSYSIPKDMTYLEAALSGESINVAQSLTK